MKLYHKNPRQITERQFKDLQESLDELGDLSGIVHDLNSDEVISGNQRSRVFDINECEITVEHEQEADRQGTVGLGHIVWRGTFYAYRQVRWTPKQCEMANIKANKLGGEWDFDTLANEFDLDELLEWGFTPFELGMDAEDVDYDELWQGMPEFEHDDKTSEYSVKVHFACKEDLEAFAELVEQPVSEKAKSIWYPAATIEPEFDRRYVGQS